MRTLRTKTVYVTIDGRNFDDRQKAQDHDDRLFSQWLSSNKEFSDFIDAAEHDVVNDRREFVRDYFEWKNGASL